MRLGCNECGQWVWQVAASAALFLPPSLSLFYSFSLSLSLSATAILVAVFLFASFHSKYKVSGFVELSTKRERKEERHRERQDATLSWGYQMIVTKS